MEMKRLSIQMRFSLIVVSLLFAITATAQKDTMLKSYAKIGLGGSGLDFSWDVPVSNKILLEAAAGLGAGYRIEETSFNYTWYLDDPVAFFTLHSKYYYNRAKRLNKGKSIDFNSGNFFGIKAKYAIKTLRYSGNRESLLVAAHWGIQRTFGKRFTGEFYVGLGYACDMSENKYGGTIYPDANVRFSYVLPFR